MRPDVLDDPANWPYADDERLQEKARQRKFEAEHCMYSSGEEMGPPGCCLAPKLFGRACKEHLNFSLDEVQAIALHLLEMTGLKRKEALELTDATIASVLHEGTWHESTKRR